MREGESSRKHCVRGPQVQAWSSQGMPWFLNLTTQHGPLQYTKHQHLGVSVPGIAPEGQVRSCEQWLHLGGE